MIRPQGEPGKARKTTERTREDKKKGPQNVTISEALFYVAIRENHFQQSKSRVARP